MRGDGPGCPARRGGERLQPKAVGGAGENRVPMIGKTGKTGFQSLEKRRNWLPMILESDEFSFVA